MARVTLQTIADALGVSRMTVSNAFSRPDQLSADLRAQVLAVAEKLGYAGPNPAARALARGTVGNVGVLLSDTLTYALTDHVANAFLAAITEELAPTGRALTLLPSLPHGGPAADQADFVPARDVAMDGAVVYSCSPDSDAVQWLIKREVPLVFVDADPRPTYPSVNVDDRGGAAAAARHLVELGHENIAIVTTGIRGEFGVLAEPADPDAAHNERERLAGWSEVLLEAGLQPRVVRRPHGDPVGSGLDAGKYLFDKASPPTGVLCFSDAVASGVLRAARDAGLSVPDDVSVVGFDDSPLARQVSPELTTVRQDITRKGRAAAAALIAQIASKDEPASARPHERVLLPTHLVARESTAPARAGRSSR
jgi:DNA-binding LacI/PurR family transcriptional regulator